MNARTRVLVPSLTSLVAILSGCQGDPKAPLGPADSYLLLAPASTAGRSPEGLCVMRRLDIKDEVVQPLPRMLETGFAFEMLRTVYLAKQFLRDGAVDGKRFSAANQPSVADATCLVLGGDSVPFGKGLALSRSFGSPQQRPAQPWIALPADLSRDKALVQTLAGRFAEYAATLVSTAGTLEGGPPASKVLIDGYRIAMEVVAREWRVGTGPAGVLQQDEGTAEQRAIFADVRENHYVMAPDGASVRSPQELLAEPGVAATVIYRMAQTRTLAGRPAPDAFYAPYAANRFPPGVSPAAVLGTFRNFQAKLLGAWASAVLRGHPPQDVIDLVEAYGAAFPQERSEAIRIFVVTTFGATAKAGGASPRPQDATTTLAELTAIAAQASAGKRSLREALSTAPEGKKL